MIARLMRPGLPPRVDPFQLAAAGGTVQGVTKVAQLPRLRDLVRDGGETELHASLEFLQGVQGAAVVIGTVTGAVTLQCQRCLGSMSWPVVTEFELNLVRSEAESRLLPPEADFLVVDEADGLNPTTLVEDELLLELPLAPRHPPGECEGSEAEPAAELEERRSPFAVLKNLKT